MHAPCVLFIIVFHALPPRCFRRLHPGFQALATALRAQGCSVSLRAAVPTQPAVTVTCAFLLVPDLFLLSCLLRPTAQPAFLLVPDLFLLSCLLRPTAQPAVTRA